MLSVPGFFGLTPSDKASLFLEPIFALIYYCGFTFNEAWRLPVAYRRWYIDRVIRELKGKNSEDPPPNRALHQNDPQTREMLGMARSQSPSRLRRFT